MGDLNEVDYERPWKKILVIGIIVVIVLILGVLVYNYFSKPNIEGDEPENFEEMFLQNCLDSCDSCEQNCYDMDFMQKAESEIDESLCDNIINEHLKNECINNIIITKAIQTGDDSLCNSIEDEERKQMCINIVEYSLNPEELPDEEE